MRSVFYQKFYLVFLVCVLFFGLGGDSSAFAQSKGKVSMKHATFDEVSDAKWSALATRKIFFGHHSVGDNIINGIIEIDKNNPNINIKARRTHDPASLNDGGIFAHDGVGQNFDPLSKIKEFKLVMDSGMGNKVDIAFMKFCFVDIGTQTDFESLFAEYKKTLAQLKKAYPHTTFVHVTVPLYVEPEGIKQSAKNFIKKLLSKDNPYENTSKAKMNQIIRAEYAGKEPLFDLAFFESTYPDGRRLTYKSDGMEHEALIPDYSSDGGHLNELGQEVLAKALLVFLANLN